MVASQTAKRIYPKHMKHSESSRIYLCILFSQCSSFPQRGSLSSFHARHLSTYETQNLPLISLHPGFMMVQCWLNLFKGNRHFRDDSPTNKMVWLTLCGSASVESMLRNKHLQKCQWLTILNTNSLFINSCWLEHLQLQAVGQVQFFFTYLSFQDSVCRGSGYMGQTLLIVNGRSTGALEETYKAS